MKESGGTWRNFYQLEKQAMDLKALGGRLQQRLLGQLPDNRTMDVLVTDLAQRKKALGDEVDHSSKDLVFLGGTAHEDRLRCRIRLHGTSVSETACTFRRLPRARQHGISMEKWAWPNVMEIS